MIPFVFIYYYTTSRIIIEMTFVIISIFTGNDCNYLFSQIVTLDKKIDTLMKISMKMAAYGD